MSRSCWWEQFRFCVSASNVHLASVFPSDTSSVHRRAHADWIFPFSPVAAGITSTVHSSRSAAAQELVSSPRDIALNSEKTQVEMWLATWHTIKVVQQQSVFTTALNCILKELVQCVWRLAGYLILRQSDKLMWQSLRWCIHSVHQHGRDAY